MVMKFSASPRLLLVLALVPGVVSAAGFELPQRGIKEMGTAYAGSAALLEDASAIGNNPAGLMRLQGRNLSGGLTLIDSSFDYDVTVRRELIEEVGGTVPGRSKGSIGELSAAPHFHYSRRISDEAALGIGVYAPFGSTTSYPEHWAGRYHATDTDITAVNITPTFAWQQTERLSFGAGIVVQAFEGEFKNKIDVGYLVADEVIKEVEETDIIGVDVTLRDGPEGVVDAMAHEFDVDNTMTVDSWAYGFNFGVLWEHSERTRIGFHYNSATRHQAEGKADRPQTRDPGFQQRLEDEISDVRLSALGIPVGTIGSQRPESAEEGAAKAVGPLGARGGDIQLLVTMPEIATLSVFHQLLDDLALLGSLTWTNWSRIEELRFTYPDGSERGGSEIVEGEEEDVRRRDLVVPFNWENTFRYGIGAVYTGLDRWTLRGGISFDETPVPDPEHRTPRGPDNDRLILGIGATWQWRDDLTVDLAYSYTDLGEPEINNRENPAGTHHRMEGDYRGYLQSLGAQLNWRF